MYNMTLTDFQIEVTYNKWWIATTTLRLFFTKPWHVRMCDSSMTCIDSRQNNYIFSVISNNWLCFTKRRFIACDFCFKKFWEKIQIEGDECNWVLKLFKQNANHISDWAERWWNVLGKMVIQNCSHCFVTIFNMAIIAAIMIFFSNIISWRSICWIEMSLRGMLWIEMTLCGMFCNHLGEKT